MGAKGGPKTGGRQKGSLNRITVELKDAILDALAEEGGVSYLRSVAQSHPPAFCALLGKVLPTTIAGDKENPIAIKATSEDYANALNAWIKENTPKS